MMLAKIINRVSKRVRPSQMKEKPAFCAAMPSSPKISNTLFNLGDTNEGIVKTAPWVANRSKQGGCIPRGASLVVLSPPEDPPRHQRTTGNPHRQPIKEGQKISV